MNLALERFGVWLRSIVVCLCGALGIVLADPAELPLVVSLLVPAFLACGVRLYSLRRPRLFPSALLWTLDAAVVVLTGLSQPVLGGEGADVMVEAIVGISVVAFQYEWATRPVAGAALAALGGAVSVLGDVLSSPGQSPDVVPLVRMLIQVGLSRAAYLIVRALARAADRSAAARAAVRREAEVAAARRATEREYLATLHDTASATLLMVSQGDGRDWSWLPPRARQDLEAMSAVPGFETGSVDLAALLDCVPEGEGQARVRLKTHIEGPLAMPSGPGLAIFNGVREAVTNVARHAGVREAELRAWTEGDGAVVELSDAGRGFDPESVPARRRGISGSIIGRMHAVGGSASVTSQPGTGTRVQWSWHGRAPASQAGDAGQATGVPRPPRAQVQHTADVRFIRGRLLYGTQLAVLLISLVWQFTVSLRRLVVHQDVYRPAWAQTAAFVCLAAVAVVGGVYLLRGRRIPPRVRWWSLGSVVAVSAVCAFTLPPDQSTAAPDWAFGVVGWHALFLLADLRVGAYAAFLGAHVGLNATAVFLSGAPTAAASAVLGISTIASCGFQLSVGVLMTHLLHGTAPAAGIAAAREEELRTRERIHEDMQRDHKERYRALTATTVPLLVGLGHGVLSPHDEEVRLRCGVEAARMRRLFAESDAVLDPLLNELRACVEVAEHQGVTVSLAVRGRPGEVPVEVRRELVDPVAVILGRTRSTARVTVVWTPPAVRVSVVSEDCAGGSGTGETDRTPGRATDAEVSVVRTTRGESVWVDAGWRRPAASGVDLT
ncbi:MULTISPECIES: sensor histidine kinase [unclassified Streptomyces]|uniref:sensor histidine kinase n=1 Tax=unclassified Streptomyces TaxID=2593676 RepID=UPI00224D07B6|nr:MULTISPECIES: ATP-binding protein [unclassified Streptomyces]MCX5334394.1 ATP-binding protein [Streptomyces sp. NBC_00140]MCX5363903.1 ATP-binding protein [Streptomyces sp. NBC_00124]